MSVNYSSSMFIGETSQGVAEPVFFDLHTPIINNKPPATLITGAPGSGKSYLAMTLTAMSAVLGKTTVVLDPKGDFMSLDNLKEDIGRINFWDLSNNLVPGMLDPFRMAKEKGDQIDLALTLIEIFTGGLNGPRKTALAPILKDVAMEDNPTMSRVVEELRGSMNEAARALGTDLNLLQSLPLSSLCFAPSGSRMVKVSLREGVTIVSLSSMEMPKENSSVNDNKSRLATGLLFLIVNFIRNLMRESESSNPKTLVIDEAWAILQTRAGAQVVKEVSLLGRSKNLALLLVTQNNSHLKHLDVESTITNRFAFSSSKKEAEVIISDMQLPKGEGFENIITNLETGECLMRDWMGRYSTVKISDWRSDWDEAFKTNPLDVERRKRKAKELE